MFATYTMEHVIIANGRDNGQVVQSEDSHKTGRTA